MILFILLWAIVSFLGLIVAVYGQIETLSDLRALRRLKRNGSLRLLANSAITQEAIAVLKLLIIFAVAVASLLKIPGRSAYAVIGLTVVVILITSQVAIRAYVRRRLIAIQLEAK